MSRIGEPSKFKVGPYDAGYPVRLNDYNWNIAVFVTEKEAKHYAEYRTKMLHKYNTTDVSVYEDV